MTDTLRWTLPDPLLIPDAFRAAIGGHALVAETLYRRGYQTIESARAFLNPDDYQPARPDELPDSIAAWDLLSDAIQQKKRIFVWGDFDVDGQTATTILVEGLRELGGEILFHIPVRGKETHGISRKVLTEYLKQGFDLLITCDTGISEHENVTLIRAEGIPVIITDHHSLTETLPPADAVVNPQRLPEDHPLRTLPGVGVAYKLIEGLFQRLEEPFDSGHYLELAALGIVADIAEQRADTRYLLQKGLQHLRFTRRVGLQTLFQQAGLNPALLNETHISFQIAPRMNAVGRLDDANAMVEFLTTSDPGRARVLATHIEALNAKRRFDTRQVGQAAENLLQNSPADRHAPAIILHHPEWPPGVIGIVASHLVERHQKPTILLTGKNPVHGSARSIPGINITALIATQSDLLNNFGGHPMAAGLSLPARKFAEFKRAILAQSAEIMESIEVFREIEITQTITIDQISLDLINEIDRLAPFGAGNPPLLFVVKNLRLVSERSVGAQEEHRLMLTEDENGMQLQFIWWKGSDEPLPEGRFDLVCSLSQSDYKGVQQISAQWVDCRLTEQNTEAAAQCQITILDHRQNTEKQVLLEQLMGENPAAILWAEGNLPEGITALSRDELTPADILILWTTPPSQSTLLEGIRKVSPKTVVVFGVEAQPNSAKGLLERLAGMAKYVIQTKGGQTTLQDLASACAAEISTIRTGLQLWEAMGKLSLHFSTGSVQINLNESSPDKSTMNIYHEIMIDQFRESQSFREYFKTGDLRNYIIPDQNK